jgi:hypothetical protein
MKCAHTLILALATAALLCAADAAVARPVQLEPRVMLTQSQLARLQAIANDGAEALRRYLWRTRMIYGWTWQDLVAAE